MGEIIIIRNDGVPIRSNKQSSPESVRTVERTMRCNTAHESLGVVLSVDKWGIRLPTVPREQQRHITIKDKIDDLQRPHSELKAEFLH